jgi:hypothetical protein
MILPMGLCVLVGILAGCGCDTDAEITNKMSKRTFARLLHDLDHERGVAAVARVKLLGRR